MSCDGVLFRVLRAFLLLRSCWTASHGHAAPVALLLAVGDMEYLDYFFVCLFGFFSPPTCSVQINGCIPHSFVVLSHKRPDEARAVSKGLRKRVIFHFEKILRVKVKRITPSHDGGSFAALFFKVEF